MLAGLLTRRGALSADTARLKALRSAGRAVANARRYGTQQAAQAAVAKFRDLARSSTSPGVTGSPDTRALRTLQAASSAVVRAGSIAERERAQAAFTHAATERAAEVRRLQIQESRPGFFDNLLSTIGQTGTLVALGAAGLLAVLVLRR